MSKFAGREWSQDFVVRLFGGNLPPSVTIQVTEDCNLACSYCYQTEKRKSRIDLSAAKKFVDMIIDNDKGMEKYLTLKGTYGVNIDFIGGEPFLEIDVIEKLTQYTLQQMIKKNSPLRYGLKFAISTNGTLYFNKKVQNYLRKYRDFIALSISVDGNKTLHDSCRKFPNGEGSYDLAIAAVKDWTMQGNQIGSKMTLCPRNISSTFEAVKELLKCGYSEINLNCVYEKGWEEKHAIILYYQLKQLADYLIDNAIDVFVSCYNANSYAPLKKDYSENWCGGNGQMIAVDPRGDIFPCIRYMKSSLGKSRAPFCIGNVESGVLSTKEQCEINNCLKCITRQSQSTKECIECPVASGCSWCTAYNYQMTGDPNKRMTYICKMHKATSLANVYYWNKQGVPFKMNLPKEDVIEIVGEEEYVRLKILDTSAQTKKHKVEKLN